MGQGNQVTSVLRSVIWKSHISCLLISNGANLKIWPHLEVQKGHQLDDSVSSKTQVGGEWGSITKMKKYRMDAGGNSILYHAENCWELMAKNK